MKKKKQSWRIRNKKPFKRIIFLYYFLLFFLIFLISLTALWFVFSPTGLTVGEFSVHIVGVPAPQQPIGGKPERVIAFEAIPDFFHFSLFPGENKTAQLLIRNTGNEKTSFKIEPENLEKFVLLSEKEFVLEPGKSEIIKLYFYIPEEKPGLYFGKILVEGNSLIKIIPVILDLPKEKPLFDLQLYIFPDYKKIRAGDKIIAQLNIKNLGWPVKPIDLNIKFSVLDFDRKIIFSEEKEVARLEKELSLVKELLIPELLPQNYLLLAEIEYLNITASAYQTFSVTEKIKKWEEEIPFPAKEIPTKWVYLAFFSFLIVLITIVLILSWKIKKLRRMP